MAPPRPEDSISQHPALPTPSSTMVPDPLGANFEFLRRGRSLNTELTSSSKLANQQTKQNNKTKQQKQKAKILQSLPAHSGRTGGFTLCSGFYVDTGDTDSDPRARLQAL